MVAFLSAAWVELQHELSADLPERPGVSARVQYVVTGSPDGDCRYHQVITDGRIVAAAVGDDPAPEVTLTQSYADARAIEGGELDASVAFMQGRVKVVGDMGKVMALMPLTQSEELAAVRRALAERTDG